MDFGDHLALCLSADAVDHLAPGFSTDVGDHPTSAARYDYLVHDDGLCLKRIDKVEQQSAGGRFVPMQVRK